MSFFLQTARKESRAENVLVAGLLSSFICCNQLEFLEIESQVDALTDHFYFYSGTVRIFKLY